MAIGTDDFEKWRHGQSNPKDSHSPAAQKPQSRAPAARSDADLTGMPTFARLRLQEHVENPRAPFTSNLSVNEFMLTRSLGLRPIAQVIGASVYHINRRKPQWQLCVSASELNELTRAHAEAWQLARDRIVQQAEAAGADVVAGVRHTRDSFDLFKSRIEKESSEQDHEAGKGSFEVFLAGTAMGFGGVDRPSPPMLSMMSGQELLALQAAGYWPGGLAYGCCVYYQPLSWTMFRSGLLARPWRSQFQNQEMADYTRGFIRARRLAVERMNDHLVSLGGIGILQTELNYSVREVEHSMKQMENEHEQTGIIMTFEAIGNVVRQFDASRRPNIRAIVPLTDT